MIAYDPWDMNPTTHRTIPVPRPGWQHDAACAGLTSLAEIEDRPGEPWPSTPDDIATAREICAACPVKEDCLADALTRDVAGMAGATTPLEREQWQAMHPGKPTPGVTLHDLIPPQHWTPALLAELTPDPHPVEDGIHGSVPPPVEAVILAWTATGMTANWIATQLDGVGGRRVTRNTVIHVRQLRAGSKRRTHKGGES